MKKIVFLFLFSGDVFASNDCHDMQILWQLDGFHNRIPDVSISSGDNLTYFDIILPPLAPEASGVAVWVQRNGLPGYSDAKIFSGKGSKNQTTWIAIPENNQDVSFGNGLKGIVEIISGDYTERGVYNGYQTYSGQYWNYDWVDQPFPLHIVEGYRYPAVVNNFLATKVRVIIEKGSAFSGEYYIQLPVKIGSEEWYQGENTCSLGHDIESAVANMPNAYPTVRVKVMASCSIEGDRTVSIAHGTITSAQARDGHLAKSQLIVNCKSPTYMKMFIQGNELISGADKNVTRCGNTGKCTLTIDGGKDYSGVVSGRKIFDITSQYRSMNANNIDSGEFSGSAIATLLMQ
ncbi:hypothetical protein [Escherichia coli]|uniref:hypothetical protein n=1 Tax=Escherichia coli TaxID=562 RepID=UPI0010F95644|nr:hypothetical protein [Escherichia coli]